MARSIILCDEHALFRDALAALLEQQPGWRVIAVAAEGGEAARLAAELRPDLVVMDVAMSAMSGIEVAESIRRETPRTGIVALSLYAHAHYLRRMLNAGAGAYVLKTEAGRELVHAINCVLQGETYVSPALRDMAFSPARARTGPDPARLTRRERQVLQLLAEGQRTREIAVNLGISPKTVETYRGRAMLKLEIDNLAGLIKFAIRSGIVSFD